MKKLFASLLAVSMIVSGVIAFAADDQPAADADMIIEHEVQGDVMLISAPVEEEVTAEKVEHAAIDFEKAAKNTVIIDGKKVIFEKGMGTLTEKDGVIFIPVRAALQALGYQVSWAEKEQMVMGANQSNGAMFIMQLNNKLLFYLNAEGEEGKITMEAAPFKNEEEWRTYVPVKALAEVVGYKVGVDQGESDALVIVLSK